MRLLYLAIINWYVGNLFASPTDNLILYLFNDDYKQTKSLRVVLVKLRKGGWLATLSPVPWIRPCTHTRACTHKHTPAHAHTRACTHTRMHTHTQTYMTDTCAKWSMMTMCDRMNLGRLNPRAQARHARLGTLYQRLRDRLSTVARSASISISPAHCTLG
jgi:hypothetical protein